MKRYLILPFLIVLLYSCDTEQKIDPTTVDRFRQEILAPKRLALLQDPQFVLDQLELIYITQNKKKLDVPILLQQIPQKYRFYREIYRYLLLKDSSGLKPNKKTFNFLLNYQTDPNVQKLLASRFAQKDSKEFFHAYFLLYALNYPFTPDEEKRFIMRSAVLGQFIALNQARLSQEKIPEFNKNLSLENSELESYLEQLLYRYTEKEVQDLKTFQKKISSDYRTGKKELRKLAKKRVKLKRRKKEDPELDAQYDQLSKQVKRMRALFKPISQILYFHGVGKRHQVKNPTEFLKNIIRYKTVITSRMGYYLYGAFKKKSFPIRLTLFRYLYTQTTPEKLSSLRKIYQKLLRDKRYNFLKYGYFKRYLPEQFKGLHLSAYRKQNLLVPAVQATYKEHLSRLLDDKFNANRLNMFRFVSKRLEQSYFDSLFNLYFIEEDKKGELYVLLTIALRGGRTLTEVQIQKVRNLKLLYFEELLDYF